MIEILTLDFPPIEGGISRYLYEIVKHMPPEQIRVIAVNAPGGHNFDAKQKFETHRLKIPSDWNAFQKQLKFFAPYYINRLIKDSDSSVIICGQAHLSLMIPAWIVSKRRHTPFAVFSFGLDLLYPQTTKYKYIFNYILRSANMVFADSTAAKEILLGLGVSPQRIRLIHPSIDPNPQPVNEKLIRTIKERYNLADKKCILTVGRLIERKGHDTVLQALPSIIKAVPQAHYLIVGRGPNEPLLKRLVHKLHLNKHVTFIGFAPEEELAAYYSICDVFVMVSREIREKGEIEGFGIVYLEANLMGKPVVAGHSGGVPDAVLHEKTGLLVNPVNIQDIATAIIRLLENKNLAQCLGETGRLRAITEFSSKTSAQKVLSILSNIVQ